MAYSPYQIAGSQADLISLLQQGRFGEQQSKIKSKTQMGQMTEEFDKQLEDAQKKAQTESQKNKGFFKGLNLLAMFLGPAAGAAVGGISSYAQGEQQRQAAKALKDVDKSRFEKTFLRDPMKKYWEEAEEKQISSGDTLRGALGSALTSFATSKMFGGSQETGGIFKKMGKSKKAAAALPGITEKAAGTLENRAMQNAIGLAKEKGLPLDSKTLSSLLEAPDSAMLQGEVSKQLGLQGFGGISEKAIQSKNPALAQLMQSLKGAARGGGLLGAEEELTGAAMLPMIIEKLLSEGGVL